MKITIPKLKKSARVIAYQKLYEKKWQAYEKAVFKRFQFVNVWAKRLNKQLTKLGRKIVDISPPWLRRVGRIVWVPFGYLVGRIKLFMGRRPHRSFRLTRRRDYKRSLQLSGYWSFTNSVRAMLWRHWRLFGGLALAYLVVAYVFNSFGQQDAYQNLTKTLNDAGGDLFQGQWGKVTGAGVLLLTAVTTGLTPDVTAAQTVLGGLTVFFIWLATVWALRNVMAGRKVKVRDAVYSSGSPVISTMLVSFMIIVQILPLSLAMIIYNAAVVSGFISGVESMLAWVVIGLLAVLSLYWITSTIIALVVVTLPGMYPWRALQTAGDLVVGRRLRILLRLLWMALVIIVTWAMILIPVILFDDWIKHIWSGIDWLPIVPISILAMSAITIVFAAAYVYMLYRKVVEDEAKPA